MYLMASLPSVTPKEVAQIELRSGTLFTFFPIVVLLAGRGVRRIGGAERQSVETGWNRGLRGLRWKLTPLDPADVPFPGCTMFLRIFLVIDSFLFGYQLVLLRLSRSRPLRAVMMMADVEGKR